MGTGLGILIGATVGVVATVVFLQGKTVPVLQTVPHDSRFATRVDPEAPAIFGNILNTTKGVN